MTNLDRARLALDHASELIADGLSTSDQPILANLVTIATAQALVSIAESLEALADQTFGRFTGMKSTQGPISD